MKMYQKQKLKHLRGGRSIKTGKIGEWRGRE